MHQPRQGRKILAQYVHERHSFKRGARAKCWVTMQDAPFLAPQAGAPRSKAPLKNAFCLLPEERWQASFGTS